MQKYTFFTVIGKVVVTAESQRLAIQQVTDIICDEIGDFTSSMIDKVMVE
jgi:hypothetical protein